MKRFLAALALVFTLGIADLAVPEPAAALSCSYSTGSSFSVGVSCTTGTYRIKVWCHNTYRGTSATTWGPIRSNGVWSFGNCPVINGYTTWWYSYQLLVY